MSRPAIRVVVADDSATIRGFLAAVLKLDKGFEIVGEAENGARCVELVGRLRPDIVLLDVDMPEMDGLAATLEIMRKSPTPIVIFTSSAVSQRHSRTGGPSPTRASHASRDTSRSAPSTRSVGTGRSLSRAAE